MLEETVSTDREIGRLQGALKALEDRVGRHEVDFATWSDGIEKKLEALMKSIAESTIKDRMMGAMWMTVLAGAGTLAVNIAFKLLYPQ